MDGQDDLVEEARNLQGPSENYDMVDLTDENDEEVIMEEVEEGSSGENSRPTSEDIREVYDAPHELMANVLDGLLGNVESNEEGEVVVEEIEEVVEEIEEKEEEVVELLDDEEEDPDDIQLVEESMTDDQQLEMRKEKCQELLNWFLHLKPELFDEPKFCSVEYLHESITEQPIFTAEFSKSVMLAYKEQGNIEGLVEKFELSSEEMVVVAVCIGVLDNENDADIDFTPLCEDRIDEWSFEKVRTFLNSRSSGLNARWGPLKMMQYILTTPSQSILLLTTTWLQDSGFPCRIDFSTDPFDIPINVDAMGLPKVVVETAIRYWKERGGEEEQEGLTSCSEFNSFFHELSTTSAEIEANIQRILDEKQEILISNLKDSVVDVDFEDKDIEELTFLGEEQKRSIQQSTKRLELLKAEMEKVAEAAQDCYRKKGQFVQMLILRPGDWCLARYTAEDDKELVFARVEEHVDQVTYRVKFVETGQVADVNIRDLALLEFGLYHPVFNTVGDVGVRVAVRYSHSTSVYTRKTSWFSGTTAGRRHAHRGDFLVFLDNGSDQYVSAPVMPTDEGYEKAAQSIQGINTLEGIRDKMHHAQMAVMLGQPTAPDGTLDRNRTSQWIRNPAKSMFIRDFMKEFPEWQLLRMPVGMKINLFNSLTDKRKLPVTVVGQDRVFAIVRYDADRLAPGFNCIEYPCKRGHVHRDEHIYRGSHRLEGAANKKQLFTAANNNLSIRRRQQFANQFEPTDMNRSMPYRLTQRPVRQRPQEIIQLEDDDGMAASEIAERRYKMNLMKRTLVKVPNFPLLEDLKPHDQCGPDCLNGLDADPYDERFYRNSPLHSPLLCGWRRTRITVKGIKKRSPFGKLIIYHGPCGKPLNTMKDVSEYLRDTRSQFTIDCFSFEEEVDTETFITVTDQQHIKMEDFADGVEGIPIPVINSIDDDMPPKMEYSKRRFQYDDSVQLGSICRDFCSGCSCEGDCSDSSKCECQQLTIQAVERLPKHLQYNGKDKITAHYKNRVLYQKVITGMYECNDQCSCHRKACHNRVVQNNIKYPMQIFKTAQSGWGVRALTDIPAGSFLCNYVGALLTNDLADQLKNDDQYFADLDLKDTVETCKMMDNDPNDEDDYGYGDSDEGNDDDEDQDDSGTVKYNRRKTDEEENETEGEEGGRLRKSTRKQKKQREEKEEKEEARPEAVFNWDSYFEDFALFVVDAKQRGNLGRFLNHSCDPNVQVQHVLYDTHDLRLPWVAFFTTRAVRAGDELCWDYAYTVCGQEDERLSCHCGAKTCRGRLL